jgi:hypothetical protein
MLNPHQPGIALEGMQLEKEKSMIESKDLNSKRRERRCEMKKTILILMAIMLGTCFIASNVFAATPKTLNVSAAVTGSTTIDVKLYKSTSSTTYNWATDLFPTMDFGTLTIADTTKPTTSPLGASQNFLALVSVTSNAGAQYYVTYTGAPLLHAVDGTTTLSSDCFTVAGGPHYNTDGTTATVYSAGLAQTTHSASATTAYNVYTSTATGGSDIFRVYFAITGDPTKTVSKTSNNLISQSQKSGTYRANVVLTLTP